MPFLLSKNNSHLKGNRCLKPLLHSFFIFREMERSGKTMKIIWGKNGLWEIEN